MLVRIAFTSLLCLQIDCLLYAGKIVVNHDEWTLSDFGFANAPDAGIFATNIAEWFTSGGSGAFLAYSAPLVVNSGVAGSQLAAAITGAGHTWTVGTALPFELPSLSAFDGIFLTGSFGSGPLNANVLIDYVNAGGNVYVAGGTGSDIFPGGASQEAAAWNTFLNAFGLSFDASYNGVGGNLAISSPHPIFIGVSTLYHLNGNSISDLDASNALNSIVVTSGSNGLYAVFDPGATSPVPEPTSALVVGTGMVCLMAFRWKHKKLPAKRQERRLW